MPKEPPPITCEHALLPRWLREAFRWRTVRDSGAWLYQENTATGRRRAVRIVGAGYQPVDRDWLHGGQGKGTVHFDNIMIMGPMERREHLGG